MTNKYQLTAEDFELDSGLLDDFDGAIIDAEFTVNADYVKVSGVEDPMLTLSIETPELSKPMSQGWTCGSARKWVIQDNGQEVVSEVNPDARKFNESARVGQLIKAMSEAIVKSGVKNINKFYLDRGYPMTQAPFYVGLKFHWSRKDLATVSGGKSSVLLPDKYLGAAETKSATKPKAQAQAPDKVTEAEGSIDEATKSLIVALASGKTNNELRASLVTNLKDVLNVKDVVNGSLLKALEDDGTLVLTDAGTYA